MAATSGKLLRQLLDHPNPWVKVGAALIVVALGLAGHEIFLDAPGPGPDPAPKTTRSSAPARGVAAGLETLGSVRLVPHRNNDGDSFVVRNGDQTFELRLYFADCAEKYLSDDYRSQRDRVADQAKDFGLTVDQAVALGKTARDKVLALLDHGAFTVYTKWEPVYDGDRFYGFVEIPDPDQPGARVYLCEWLVRHGLARIHTKGETTPDGRSAAEFGNHLRDVEAGARKRKEGAWGI